PQMSFATVAAATGLSASMRGFASAAARRLPRLAARLAGAAARAAVVPVSEHDIIERLIAAQDVLNRIDMVIAPSPSIAVEFRKLGLDSSKIRVSDYGFVPLGRLQSTRRSGPLRIGYVGTLVWHKGVHVLLEAARHLPAAAFELNIFGDETVFATYSAQLRAQAAGLPVRFRGAFDRTQVSEVFSNIDVLVVPSLWLENSPLVIHEAFMAGVPVVGARMGGIADLVRHGENGLLYEATSARGLATALQQLIDSPERLAAFARRLPAVKPIRQDARECEDAYFAVLDRAVAGAVR